MLIVDESQSPAKFRSTQCDKTGFARLQLIQIPALSLYKPI